MRLGVITVHFCLLRGCLRCYSWPGYYHGSGEDDHLPVLAMRQSLARLPRSVIVYLKPVGKVLYQNPSISV